MFFNPRSSQDPVADNATTFSSDEFKQFTTANGIRNIFSAPYHAASNGLAERAVQTVKQGLKKMNGGSLASKLYRFLARYRVTPHSTTQTSPAELLLKRKPRSRLDLLLPDISNTVFCAQSAQKRYHDQHAADRHFEIRIPYLL